MILSKFNRLYEQKLLEAKRRDFYGIFTSNSIDMNRVDRLMGIVTALQSKKHLSAEAIAQRFEISVRTVYRDIRALDEIGIPVGFEPARVIL